MKVGIVGGGAAGIMSALFACNGKDEVTVIEHNDKLLKKILSTGNGKCNFTNTKLEPSNYHYNERAIKFIERFNQYDIIKFFNSIGVVEYIKDGYVYPNSEQAASIRNALLMELGRYDVKILLNTYVKDINKNMGITVIVITHEMKVIESICDRVAIIENSKIAEIGKVEDIFSNPKSDIGKKLILGDAFQTKEIVSGVKLRIEFDGRSSFEPVLSNMILSCGIPVNILYAKTKDIGGAAVGHMIIQISGEEEALKVKRYMDSIGMIYHEVEFAEEKEEIE